jgi:hypothetical protein
VSIGAEAREIALEIILELPHRHDARGGLRSESHDGAARYEPSNAPQRWKVNRRLGRRENLLGARLTGVGRFVDGPTDLRLQVGAGRQWRSGGGENLDIAEVECDRRRDRDADEISHRDLQRLAAERDTTRISREAAISL